MTPNQTELKDGEHVYLLSQTKKRLMKAFYVSGNIGNNKTLAKDECRFQIVEIMTENISCWQFNPDIHCSGKVIGWKTNLVEHDDNRVLRRPEYSLERIIDPDTLLDYQAHYIDCNKCRTGCTLSEDRVYMQWFEMKGTPAQETPKKAPPVKRQKNQRMQNKRLKLEGKSYQNRKGKDIPEVPPMEFIQCKCKNKCADTFPEESRNAAYVNFWSIASIDQRRQYIVDRVISVSKKQTTTRDNSRRLQTWAYFLEKEGTHGADRIEVCKSVFYKTLQVKEKFIRYAVQASNLGVAKKETRGKHAPSNKRKPDDVQRIRDHINMFPRVESHYVRKDTTKTYICDTSNFNKLTIKRMYDLYCQQCTEHEVKPVCYELYRQEFKDMNIAIHKPKKDQCKSCIGFGNMLTPTEEDVQEHKLHIKRKNEAYDIKEKVKKEAEKDKSTLAITFDLEAVLYTPCTKVSTLFYKRKLCTYNLTMFNLANKEGQCYLWNETVAKRGSNEIGTGLRLFMEKHKSAKRLFMISDACGGQTRNQFIACLCMYLVRHMEHLEQIDHMFMVSGHSHMEVDSMHSRIEKKSDTLNIFVPFEWAVVASIARKNPYEVYHVETEDVKDLKRLQQDMKITNMKKDSDGNTVHWTSGQGYSSNDIVSWLMYRKQDPESIYYRTDYDENKPFKKIITSRVMRNSIEPALHQAYKGSLPISKAKLDDLLKLCNERAIPPMYHHFYKNIQSDQDIGEDTFSDSDQDD